MLEAERWAGLLGCQPVDPRRGAVLALIYQKDGEPHLCLFRRSETLGRHRGEICLPGGAAEADDADPVATALREAAEEVGIDPTAVRVVGVLEPVYIPPSHFLITPVVATADRRPDFRPDPAEVAELLEVPIAGLAGVAGEETRPVLGVLMRLPVYHWQGHRIWGATARVLQQFLSHWDGGPHPLPPLHCDGEGRS